MIKTKSIVVSGNVESEKGFGHLLQSSNGMRHSVQVERFDAVVPKAVDNLMKEYGLRWNWPWKKTEFDKLSGLKKHPYVTTVPQSKMACALSHYLLWRECAETQEPILVLEHDAVFTLPQ